MLYISLIIWLSISLAYFILDISLLHNILKIKNRHKPNTSNGVSVIIAARNEARNLNQNLIHILDQKHSNFEVIVANDNSSDETTEVLENLQHQYSNVSCLHITSGKPSKKNALTEAIAISKFDTLCLTDADCWPQSPNWLSTMEGYISEEKPIVLGYSPYSNHKGLLNKLIRYETLQTAISYYGFAKLGMPYMAVGRNLMYKKEVFNSLNGFENHKHVLSGDDDLLVNQAISTYKIALCLDSQSFVETSPEKTFKSWTAQKRRHISTANHYKPWHQLVLGFQYIIRFLFWYAVLPYMGFLLLSEPLFFTIFSLFFILFVTIKAIYLKKVFKRFGSYSLLKFTPILEFFLLHVHLYIFFCNLIHPKKDW